MSTEPTVPISGLMRLRAQYTEKGATDTERQIIDQLDLGIGMTLLACGIERCENGNI